MKFLTLETFRLGLTNLKLHKLRSLLTSLGIIFGVAAVICMLSISEGASADEMRMIKLLGTKNVIVNSVKPSQTKEVAQGNTNLVEYGVTRTDLSIIERTIPHISHIVPMKTVAYQARHGEHAAAIHSIGTTPAFFKVVNIEIEQGRALVSQDMDEMSNVCVIGQEVRRSLFPSKDPIGERILVARYPNAVPFKVVGLLKWLKTAGAPARGVEQRNLNNEILIPFSTAESQFGETTRKVGAGSREFIKMQFSGLRLRCSTRRNVRPQAWREMI